jgi:hypothetical protein
MISWSKLTFLGWMVASLPSGRRAGPIHHWQNPVHITKLMSNFNNCLFKKFSTTPMLVLTLITQDWLRNLLSFLKILFEIETQADACTDNFLPDIVGIRLFGFFVSLVFISWAMPGIRAK